jgi:integrase
MPRRAKAKGLYQRGPYWLDWDKRTDGTLRSPFLYINWYDPSRGRPRSASTRTADVEAGKLALDAHFADRERGQAICPTCGQSRQGANGYLLANAISNYQLTVGSKRTSADAIRARLNHVLNYIATLSDVSVRVADVDERWIDAFRAWASKVPVAVPNGQTRERRPGTVEASVRALAAVINEAHRRGHVTVKAQFTAIAPHEVSRTPIHRSDVPELAKMFAYALDGKRRKRCAPLHRFLIASVATAARPDAVLDLSTKPDRRQWLSDRSVVRLNPEGRRQTKKYRATIKAPWQFAAWLDADAETGPGPFVPVTSVKHAWATMAKALELPADGEAGTKLIRRSVAQLLRDRGVPGDELELLLGHRQIKATTDTYAPFKPEYLANAIREVEAIIDEIESLVPGSFYRSNTGEDLNVVPLKGAKSA